MREGPTSDYLDPADTTLQGAAAVANVLADRGVEVVVVRNAEAMAGTPLDADSAVVVTSADTLGESSAQALAAQVDAADGSLLVVVNPPPYAAEPLGFSAVGSGGPGQRSGNCAQDDYDTLRLNAPGGADFDGEVVCFPGERGGWLAWPTPERAVLGAGSVLTNGEILNGDNAAVALRLLGSRERLVWYVADPSDQFSDDPVALDQLLPRWLYPALVLVGLAVLLLMAWRGRRLGPVLREPLPVVVKAIETTLGRGRSYRRVGDRAHAAARLRAATTERLIRALRLPPQAGVTEVATVLAPRVASTADDIQRLLDPHAPPPSTDRELVALAQALAALEEGPSHDPRAH